MRAHSDVARHIGHGSAARVEVAPERSNVPSCWHALRIAVTLGVRRGIEVRGDPVDALERPAVGRDRGGAERTSAFRTLSVAGATA
jgi:hypothetical protein